MSRHNNQSNPQSSVSHRERQTIHIAMVSFADFGGGAHRAAARVYKALHEFGEHYGLRVTFYAVTSSMELPSVQSLRRISRSPSPRLDWIRSLFLEVRHLIWRAIGGRSRHSVAKVRTGIPQALGRTGHDAILLNWLGDGTASLEEISELRRPLLLRNADHWWLRGSEHFPAGQEYEHPLRLWLERFFYTRSDITTRRRKRELIFPLVAGTVSSSRGMLLESKAALPEAVHMRILNPIDARVWFPEPRDQARRERGIPQDVVSIGYGAHGGLSDPRKGGKALLGALRRVAYMRDSSQAIRFDYFGGKSSSRTARLLPGTQHGVLDDVELRNFYSAVDVFVVPSRAEGFPNTVLEALACGCPVVAFGIEPFQSAVEFADYILLAEPDSEQNLAEKIVLAIEDSSWRRRVRKSAPAAVQKECSPSVVTKRYARLAFASMDAWRPLDE